MAIFQYIGMTLAFAYGSFTALTGIMQIKLKRVPFVSAFSFFLIGGTLACSSILFFQSTYFFHTLILSLLFIQITALYNGYYLYGKWTVRHHFVRFLLSFSIILLLNL